MVTVGAGNLGLTFTHRFKFETSQDDPNDPNSPFTYWDGGVLEFSTDAGVTWTDVATIIDPGYGGVIGDGPDGASNPLEDREGLVGQNAAWPATDVVSLDLGAGFAGQNVQVRFRIGTDEASADFGWEIDDVTFTGIVGTPFPSIVADATVCMAQGMPPVANAGPDASAPENSGVTLDASGSSDPDGDALTFAWEQIGGPDVQLSATDAVTATFTAPDIDVDTVLTFQVTVTAADGEDTDTVAITVTPLSATSSSSSGAGGGATSSTGGEVGATTGSGNPFGDVGGEPVEDDGCGCRAAPAAPPGSTGAAAALAMALLAVRRRRRR